MKKIVVLILFTLCVSMQPAYAYLDPGTGSLIVQILIAAFATVAIFFKTIWQSIKSVLHIGKRSDKNSEESEDEED